MSGRCSTTVTKVPDKPDHHYYFADGGQRMWDRGEHDPMGLDWLVRFIEHNKGAVLKLEVHYDPNKVIPPAWEEVSEEP